MDNQSFLERITTCFNDTTCMLKYGISFIFVLIIFGLLYFSNNSRISNVTVFLGSIFIIGVSVLTSYTSINYLQLLTKGTNMMINSILFFCILGVSIYFYIANEPGVASYIAIFLVPILLLILIISLAIFFYLFVNSIRYKEGLPGFIINLIFFIPCMVLDYFQYLKSEMNSTTNVIYYLFITQILLIILYISVPAFINKFVMVNTDNKIESDPLHVKYNIDNALHVLSDGSALIINKPVSLTREFIAGTPMKEGFSTTTSEQDLRSGINANALFSNFIETYVTQTNSDIQGDMGQTNSDIQGDIGQTNSDIQGDIGQTGTQFGQSTAQTGTQIGQSTAQTGTQFGQSTAQTGTQIGQSTAQTGTQFGQSTAQTGTQIGQSTAQTGAQFGQSTSQITKSVVSKILDNLDYLNPLSKQTRNNTLDQVSYDSGKNQRNYSISLWFYYNAHSSNNIAYSGETNIFSFGDGIPKITYINKDNNDNKKNIRIYFTNNENAINKSYDIDLQTQKWNQLVFNYTSTQADLFVNGELVYTYMFDTIQKLPDINPTNLIKLGDKKGLDGSIKDVRFYNSPRTKNDIVTSYNVIQKKKQLDENNLLE